MLVAESRGGGEEEAASASTCDGKAHMAGITMAAVRSRSACEEEEEEEEEEDDDDDNDDDENDEGFEEHEL